MTDYMDQVQELEERERQAAIARIRARISETAPSPLPPLAPVQENEA